jgi:hypothetical protein
MSFTSIILNFMYFMYLMLFLEQNLNLGFIKAMAQPSPSLLHRVSPEPAAGSMRSWLKADSELINNKNPIHRYMSVHLWSHSPAKYLP